jgi:superfamily II DNA or RNA helicase
MATDKETGTEILQQDRVDLKGLLPQQQGGPLLVSGQADGEKMVLAIGKHRFYNQLYLELISAKTTREGKLKNPLMKVQPAGQLWQATDPDVLKFFSAVLYFQNNYSEERSASDFNALLAVVKNPLGLPYFLHDSAVSSNITAASVVPQRMRLLVPDLRLTVHKTDEYYEVSGKLTIDGKAHALENILLKHHYFIQQSSVLYLIDNPYFLHVISFFKKHQGRLVVPHAEFEEFQENVLSKLEEKVKITHSYVKVATQKQLSDTGFDLENERLIYLSESEDFVLLTPVMRYANVEIPVLSQKQIRTKDRLGKVFTVARDEEAELQFITEIMRQHPYFSEQMKDFEGMNPSITMDCFYLHRKYFADPAWFLEAFAEWRNKSIVILGFNELKENKLSPYKAEIAIHVISGMDWFETAVKIKYGKQLVSLKHLHKSIRNKSKFVQLDDGTMGVLPDDWIGRFADFFKAGELVEELIRTEKINFARVAELYEESLMDDGLKEELEMLQLRLGGMETIEEIPIPKELHAELRNYQKEGLYWLNFLDQFNFGACLADDMGLGKTVQILAFILSQRSKEHQNTNLVVVPASLVFNWQAEIAKFAPSLKVRVLYGAERSKAILNFDDYEVVLTSYGTLLSDIKYLKDYRFNYIFLDESQNIKNPESQRYKAARLLRSRNKVVMTGTPVENNTYDLYGQLSFACPGLLGSRQQFKQLYSVPIDQFKDSKRAAQLQKKISPFILRRTKEQVARELPDKTEMVVYCEMGAAQREIYDAYAKEIRDYLLGIAEDELPKSSMHVLQGITKLRQICNAPALLSDAKYYGSESAKMDVLMEQIEARSEQHKILVFSQFVTMLDLIREELKKRSIAFSYLTGQTSRRGDVVQSFQEDPSKRVFLISLKAGGVGLNLTEADYVYLVDPWWNPAVENQAIDRTYRIGQHKNVMAVRLICPNTIEEKIMLIQEGKRTLSGDLVRTEDSIFKSLTRKDLLSLLDK